MFGGCACWVFGGGGGYGLVVLVCWGFFNLKHDKVKLDFITKVISDIAICKVLYA